MIPVLPIIILGCILILWVFIIFLPSLAMFTVRCSADPKQLKGFKLWNWRMYVNPHAYGKWLGEQARASLQPRYRPGRSIPLSSDTEAHSGSQPVSFGGHRIGVAERECVVCAHSWFPKTDPNESCPNCGA